MLELTGFYMEKAFTEREFQTNHNVCFETVKVSFVFKYSIESLEFSGAAKLIIIFTSQVGNYKLKTYRKRRCR